MAEAVTQLRLAADSGTRHARAAHRMLSAVERPPRRWRRPCAVRSTPWTPMPRTRQPPLSRRFLDPRPLPPPGPDARQRTPGPPERLWAARSLGDAPPPRGPVRLGRHRGIIPCVSAPRFLVAMLALACAEGASGSAQPPTSSPPEASGWPRGTALGSTPPGRRPQIDMTSARTGAGGDVYGSAATPTPSTPPSRADSSWWLQHPRRTNLRQARTSGQGTRRDPRLHGSSAATGRGDLREAGRPGPDGGRSRSRSRARRCRCRPPRPSPWRWSRVI